MVVKRNPPGVPAAMRPMIAIPVGTIQRGRLRGGAGACAGATATCAPHGGVCGGAGSSYVGWTATTGAGSAMATVVPTSPSPPTGGMPKDPFSGLIDIVLISCLRVACNGDDRRQRVARCRQQMY